MNNLESRIARWENRLRALRPPPLTFWEDDQYLWATDPETFRRQSMEPGRFQGMMEGIMKSPIPMRIFGFLAFEQLLKESRQQKQPETAEQPGGQVPTPLPKVQQPPGGSPPAADSPAGDSPCPRNGTAKPNRRGTPHSPMEKQEYSKMKTNPKGTRTRRVSPKAKGPDLPVAPAIPEADPAASGNRKEKS